MWRCAWPSAASALLTSSPGRCGAALTRPSHETLTSNENRNCSASVMGRVASSPRVIVTSPSSCFCSWSARGCHSMPSERRRRAHLEHVIRSEDRSRHYVRLHRFRRPGDGTSGKQGILAPLQTVPLPSRLYAAAASRPQRKVGPSTHMRWRTTASCLRQRHLRSLIPRRLATSSAQP